MSQLGCLPGACATNRCCRNGPRKGRKAADAKQQDGEGADEDEAPEGSDDDGDGGGGADAWTTKLATLGTGGGIFGAWVAPGNPRWLKNNVASARIGEKKAYLEKKVGERCWGAR